eukprot:6573005-Lingulodinium_polyedra.AAC.1
MGVSAARKRAAIGSAVSPITACHNSCGMWLKGGRREPTRGGERRGRCSHGRRRREWPLGAATAPARRRGRGTRPNRSQ